MIKTWIENNKLYINSSEDLGDVNLVIIAYDKVIYGCNTNIDSGLNYWFEPNISLENYAKVLIEIRKEDLIIYSETIPSNLNIKKPEDSDISIVLSYANTTEKERYLTECLRSIRGKKILVSHYPVSEFHQRLSDYTIYKSGNPLLYQKDFEKYNLNFFYTSTINGKKETRQYKFDHQYAVYSLVQTGLNFAKSLGYEHAHIINYDYEIISDILNTHIDLLKTDYDLVFYLWAKNSYNTGFFSGKINTLLEYFNLHYSIGSFYCHNNAFLLEDRVYNYFNSLNVKIKEMDDTSTKNSVICDKIGLINEQF